MASPIASYSESAALSLRDKYAFAFSGARTGGPWGGGDDGPSWFGIAAAILAGFMLAFFTAVVNVPPVAAIPP